jgi:hypothetical protein
MAVRKGFLNLKRMSLGRQLTTLALITGGIAVGFTTTGLIAYEVLWFRGQLANSAASTADILGSNIAAALAFGNHALLETMRAGIGEFLAPPFKLQDGANTRRAEKTIAKIESA